MTKAQGKSLELLPVKIPVWWTFGALFAGLLAGMMMGDRLSFLQPVGAMWLRALQMTIIPLVASLLILGLGQMVQAAKAGRSAMIMLGLVAALLLISGTLSAVFMPMVLEAFPVHGAGALLADAPRGEDLQVPAIGDFIASLIAPNIIAAAAENAMLPLTIFFALLAVAIARLPDDQRIILTHFFHALGNAMLTIIGWVLWAAPVGVFALAAGVGAQSGGGAFAALLHYILAVSAMGGIVLIIAYALAIFGARQSPLAFARAMIAPQAVAISTQSSLASLPAMLEAARRLGIEERVREFVLPLAVAIFRATSPAMNMGVAIYAAHLSGVELTPLSLAAGVGVAFIISIGSVSLPGSLSFVISIGPIAMAMGAPVHVLALLVAVEMVPDIMRTLGNVTMNVALAGTVERLSKD